MMRYEPHRKIRPLSSERSKSLCKKITENKGGFVDVPNEVAYESRDESTVE